MAKFLVPKSGMIAGHSCLYVSSGKRKKSQVPLVLIHGACAGAWSWETFMPAMAKQGFDAYALDLVGHDKKKVCHNLGDLGIEDYALDVKHFLDALGTKYKVPPIVFGHSMGGLVAQKLAEMCPLSGLVLLASAPPSGIAYRPGVGTEKIPFMKILGSALDLLMQKTLMPDRRIILGGLTHFDEREAHAIYEKFVPESGRATREIVFGSVRVDHERIQVPTLVVCGTEDNVIHVSVSREIAKRYEAEIHEYSDMDHILIFGPGWEEVAKNCLTWVKKNI